MVARIDAAAKCELRSVICFLQAEDCAVVTQQLLEQVKWDVSDQPAYSPDLATSDFHLLPELKNWLGGQRSRKMRRFKATLRHISHHWRQRSSERISETWSSDMTNARIFTAVMPTNYLAHAPCFKNISTDSKKCAPKYRKMAILSQELKEEDKDSALKSVCCALRDFTLCKHEHAIRDCGPGAIQFLQRHMERMSGSLINEHCVLYTYGAGSCSSHLRNSRVPSKSSSHWLLLLIMVISVLYIS
ncbi:hypothetical protein AVEN_158989-1 [Araneus ventricosus]|uniref:Uncharacterized protein n=1 Tax=Araneus ventricosus TaxID=182803 RepID=A0A4Y2BA34_ARAVE|nr:hypothetical protein AVEN_158989-1 [Araneus ventricosus]